jgi:hydrophobic/amphiphilic exporter-1 (mainly G- bacteria), HAE1 family
MEQKSFGRRFVEAIFGNAQIVALFFVFLVVGGVAAFVASRPQGFPDVNVNIALVTTVYPGATASQVEDKIVKPIEAVVAEMDSVTEYSSTANDSFAVLVVTFDEEANVNDGLRDLSSKLARVNLPEGVETPQVSDIATGGDFDFLVAVVDGGNVFDLYNDADLVKTKVEGIEGVSKVAIVNAVTPQVEVRLDDGRLQERGVSRAQVEGILQAAQLDIPVGKFVDGEQNKVNVGITKRLDDIVAIGELLVGPNIRLRDVAEVRIDMANNDHYNRSGFPKNDELDASSEREPLQVERSIRLAITARDDADIIALSHRLSDLYEELRTSNEPSGSAKVVELYSMADMTQGQVDEIKAGIFGEWVKEWGPAGILGYLFGGVTLVLLFLLIFINWRVAALAALSIPLALGVTAMYLKLIGVQLDTIVLFSMILVIGLVVDPTIVFLEAMQRYRQQGLSAKEAAIKTIETVGLGVSLSAITNFTVFVPFGVVSGFFGQIISHIPVTVIPALIASVIIPAVFFLPVSAKWLKPMWRKGGTNDALSAGGAGDGADELAGAWQFSKWLGRAITNLLAPGVDKQILRGLLIIVAVALPLVVAGTLVGSKAVKFVQFAEEDDSEEILIYGTVNAAWDFDKAVAAVEPVQDYLARQAEIKSFSYFQQDGNSFTMLALLWPMEDRRMEDLRTSTELASDLNDYFAAIKNIELEAVTMAVGPPSDSFPVKIRIFDADLDKLANAAVDTKTWLGEQEGVIKVEDSLATAGATVSGTSLVMDSQNPLNLNPMATVAALKERLDENVVTTVEVDGVSWEVVTTMNDPINSIDELKEVPVASPLASVASTTMPFGIVKPQSKIYDLITGTEQQTAKSIQRLNGKRYVEVRAKLDEDADPIEMQTKLNDYLDGDKLEELGLAEDATESKGEADVIAKSFTELLIALGIALFIIYILLTAFFKSAISPLIIMFAIPLGLVGGLPAVAVTTGQLGFLELLGVVAMAGIVVNVTILIIDFANQLQRQGKTPQEAIATAVAVRYKAIFLTKATIFGGLMPLVIFSPFWRGLASVMIFGIIVSCILSLFTTPILYMWVQAIGGTPKKSQRTPDRQYEPVLKNDIQPTAIASKSQPMGEQQLEEILRGLSN